MSKVDWEYIKKAITKNYELAATPSQAKFEFKVRAKALFELKARVDDMRNHVQESLLIIAKRMDGLGKRLAELEKWRKWECRFIPEPPSRSLIMEGPGVWCTSCGKKLDPESRECDCQDKPDEEKWFDESTLHPPTRSEPKCICIHHHGNIVYKRNPDCPKCNPRPPGPKDVSELTTPFTSDGNRKPKPEREKDFNNRTAGMMSGEYRSAVLKRLHKPDKHESRKMVYLNEVDAQQHGESLDDGKHEPIPVTPDKQDEPRKGELVWMEDWKTRIYVASEYAGKNALYVHPDQIDVVRMLKEALEKIGRLQSYEFLPNARTTSRDALDAIGNRVTITRRGK